METLDRWLVSADNALRTLAGAVHAARDIYSGAETASGPDLVVLTRPGFDVKAKPGAKTLFGRVAPAREPERGAEPSAEGPRDGEAVHAGKPDVDDRDVGVFFDDQRDGDDHPEHAEEKHPSENAN